jgi:glucokinase
MSEANTVLGIDMGGTGIKSASLRFPDGLCLHQKIAPTRDGETVDGRPAFVAEIRQLIDWHEAALGHRLRYIGLSAPGLANRVGDAIAFMPGRLHGLEGLVWGEALQRPFPVPVINDGHAALLGEIWLGAAKGLDDVVMYTLGTGVGGAIVCDGKLLRGRFGRAGQSILTEHRIFVEHLAASKTRSVSRRLESAAMTNSQRPRPSSKPTQRAIRSRPTFG